MNATGHFLRQSRQNFHPAAFICLSKIKNKQGFTLLEVLVALSVFAVMAIIAYSSLNSVLATRAQIETQAESLKQLQIVFQRIQQDLNQYSERDIRDEYADIQLSFIGEAQVIEFTRLGWQNPAQTPRSDFQRLRYFVQNKTLWRSHWQVLDRAQDSQPLSIPLLEQISAFRWRFLDEQQQWHEDWQLKTFKQLNPNAELPRLVAVELTLNLEQWGQITRLFALNSQLQTLILHDKSHNNKNEKDEKTDKDNKKTDDKNTINLPTETNTDRHSRDID